MFAATRSCKTDLNDFFWGRKSGFKVIVFVSFLKNLVLVFSNKKELKMSYVCLTTNQCFEFFIFYITLQQPTKCFYKILVLYFLGADRSENGGMELWKVSQFCVKLQQSKGFKFIWTIMFFSLFFFLAVSILIRGGLKLCIRESDMESFKKVLFCSWFFSLI